MSQSNLHPRSEGAASPRDEVFA